MNTAFSQAVKFVIVGILNTAVDFAVLNLLMLATGIVAGLGFSLFKALSFLVAVINSYFWNKHWTFQSEREVFLQFLAVSAIGFFLNVGTASFLVNSVGPQFGLTEQLWANAGAAAGTLVVMTWNFLGYKFVVFKK